MTETDSISSSFLLSAMPKRATADAPSAGPGKVSRSVSGQAREKFPKDEMGEFEDPWEDEVEDDDEADGAFDPSPDMHVHGQQTYSYGG